MIVSSLPSTCCDGLDREEPLRLRVSPWQTVSKGLGRMERKSLKDRRWAASISSAEGRTGATGRGKSLESKASSVLLYRPKALATPRRVGTTDLHRYSRQENERFNWPIVTCHEHTGTLLQYLYHEPLGFYRYFAGPAWCPWLPPTPESNDHKLKVSWEVFYIWYFNHTIALLHNAHCLPVLQSFQPLPHVPWLLFYHCPVAGKEMLWMASYTKISIWIKTKKRFLLKTQTFPRKVSSRWATSESSVTREKLKFSATGSFSERQKAKYFKTSNLWR